MKIIQQTLIILFALQFNLLIAQTGGTLSTPVPFDVQQNLEAISEMSPVSVGGLGFDFRYEGVVGHPYLSEDWRPAKVKIQGKYYKDSTALYNVDLMDNLIFIRMKGSIYSTVPMVAFEELHFGGNEAISYVVLKSNESPEDNATAKLGEIIHNGKYQFTKQIFKKLNKADISDNGYGGGKHYDEYKTKFNYYLQGPDGRLEKIKIKKKSITKAFPELAKPMSTYLKANKASMYSEGDLANFLKSLD